MSSGKVPGIVIIFLFTAVAVQAANNKWSTNGPFGGFIGSFSFHPQNRNLIFATSSSGLLRSKNGGLTWQRLDVSEGTFTGYPVKIHPRNPGVILAGSNTLYASTDQGDTWKVISNNPVPKDGFADIEFHLSDPQVLYGVTFRSGVFKSNDGGTTWIAKNKGLQFEPVGRDDTPALEIDPANPKVIYVLPASRKVFKTVNAGENWKAASKGIDFSGIDNFLSQEQALVLDPKNSQVLYAAGPGHIFKTVDGAKTWRDVNCACGAHEISIDPRNSQVLYAAQHQLLKSTDGGLSWRKKIVHPLFANNNLTVAIHPKSNKQVFVGGFGGGIFRSQDAGASWRVVNGGVDDFRVAHVSISPLRPKQIIATGPEVPFISRNGGLTWSGLDLERPGFGVSDVQIHPKNPNLFVAATGQPGIAISRDAGKNWQHTGPETGLVAEAVALDPVDQNTVYAAIFVPGGQTGTNGKGIAKTTDGGQTWKFVNRGLSIKNLLSLTIDPKNRLNLFTGTTEGTVFRTTNGGNQWKGSKVFSGCCIGSIAIDPADSKIIYVSGEQRGIFKSIDGGQKWKQSNEGLPSGGTFLFVHSDVSNPQLIFAGGFAGLFVSTDRAENWSLFDSNGLGTFPLQDLIVNPEQINQLFLAADRGVFAYTRKTSSPSPSSPVIDQLLPSIGKPGDTISIIGRNFGSIQGDSKISFSGVDTAPTQSWSDTRVTLNVPDGARIGPVAATVASRRSNGFEFIVLPSDGNMNPTSGPAAGGTKIAILSSLQLEGARFDVLFGSTLARDVVFIGPNIVICTSPPGTGIVDVSIVSTAITESRGTFTYE